MNPRKVYSTGRLAGRGKKSHKNRLKAEGLYAEAYRAMKHNGLNKSQIRSIMKEVEPVGEQELALMLEFKCDLLEAREKIHSAMQYGLIEFTGSKPAWIQGMGV